MAGSKGKGKKKGKKGVGGDKKKKMKPVPEGLALNEMTQKQLRTYIRKLLIEIDREREERNFFMLEREKQFLLWNIILEQIAQEKDRARLLEVHYDDAEREKDKEMTVWKQKLRHMMGEQTEKLAKARLVNLYKMKRVQDEIWEILMTLRDGMLDKHQQLRALQASKYGLLQMMQQNHSDEVTALRQQFAEEVKRMSEYTEREADDERKRHDLINSGELAVIRSKKEEQFDSMLYMHEKQLLEMKTFFNDLEVNNMAVIGSLQQEIAQKKVNERRLQRSLNEIKAKHELLSNPIEEYEVKVVEWKDDAVEMEKLKKDIAGAEKQLAQNNTYLRHMTCANEALVEKSHYIEKEGNALRHCFTKSVIRSQMKSTMGRMVAGFRNRAEDAGYALYLPPDASKTRLKKKPPVCKTFEPLFQKPAFAFNECIFPDVNDPPHPYCRAVRSRDRTKPELTCDSDAAQLASTFSPHYLPPLPSRVNGGISFFGVNE